MAENTKNTTDTDMTVGEHINELRSRLVRVVLVLVVIGVVAFAYKGVVLDILFAPSEPSFITNRVFAHFAELMNAPALKINSTPIEIINTRMAGQFNLHIKSSFVFALIIALPFLLWQLWAFIRPAIPQNVQLRCKDYIWQICLWFFTGLFFGYFVISPLTVNFLSGYQVSANITNMIDVNSFMSSVLGVSFAAAIVFQLPLLVRMLATVGILTAKIMRKQRKIAVIVILVVSAIITPPDVFSQVLIAIPLYGLYEYGITIAAKIEARKAKEALVVK